MIHVRRAKDRGHANHGWLEIYHTFSFSTYQDPQHMWFRSLSIYLSKIDAGNAFEQVLLENRFAWLQVLRGTVSLNGLDLGTSDGAAVSDARALTVQAHTEAEIMLFDVA